MHKYLVIVESPAKVKTISKFLGANYKVMASQGHVRDLPKSQMGVDIEHDYEPKYITIRGKGDILTLYPLHSAIAYIILYCSSDNKYPLHIQEQQDCIHLY